MKARVRMTPADHMPMVTAPSVVVDIVLEAVHEIEARGGDDTDEASEQRQPHEVACCLVVRRGAPGHHEPP